VKSFLTTMAETNAKLAQKDMHTASVIHELRNPLNSYILCIIFRVIGCLDLLKDIPNLTEEDKDTIRVAVTCGDILMTLIGNALDAAKLDAGKVALDIIETDIFELLKNVFSTSKLKSKEKGIKLKLFASYDMPKTVLIDGNRLT
jgi:signal transduction histidine kinase